MGTAISAELWYISPYKKVTWRWKVLTKTGAMSAGMSECWKTRAVILAYHGFWKNSEGLFRSRHDRIEHGKAPSQIWAELRIVRLPHWGHQVGRYNHVRKCKTILWWMPIPGLKYLMKITMDYEGTDIVMHYACNCS